MTIPQPIRWATTAEVTLRHGRRAFSIALAARFPTLRHAARYRIVLGTVNGVGLLFIGFSRKRRDLESW